MKKNKYGIIISVIILVIFLIDWFAITKLSKKETPKNKEELRIIIEDIRNNLSGEQLEKCSIEMDKIFLKKSELNLEELAESFKTATIGGLSHPENICYFIFRNKDAEPSYMLEIYLSVKDSGQTAYGSISICEDGKPIYGIPFISDKMTDWAYDIGIFSK